MIFRSFLCLCRKGTAKVIPSRQRSPEGRGRDTNFCHQSVTRKRTWPGV